jgi:hypothetical protein
VTNYLQVSASLNNISCFFCQQILFIPRVADRYRNSRYPQNCYISCLTFLHITSRHTVLTQWNTVLLNKVTVRSAGHEISRLLWNWKSHAAFITAHHDPYFKSDEVSPQTPNQFLLRPTLVTSCHLHIGLPTGLFFSGSELL